MNKRLIIDGSGWRLRNPENVAMDLMGDPLSFEEAYLKAEKASETEPGEWTITCCTKWPSHIKRAVHKIVFENGEETDRWIFDNREYDSKFDKVADSQEAPLEETPKKKRGRPPKERSAAFSPTTPQPVEKKKRGRPPKDKSLGPGQ